MHDKVKSEFQEHASYRNYIRDIILGANDGLISVFALVIGVAGGGLDPRNVLLAGIAGLVAGALSMAIGEYLSTKSQEELYDAEKTMEASHIEHHIEHEKGELREWYAEKGFSGELLEKIVETIASDPEILLKEMMMAEFGVLEEERRSPIKATLIIGIAFAVGAFPPIFPFIFVNSTQTGIILAGIISVLALFSVGSMKAVVTSTNILRSGSENMVLGLLGALITYIIGYFVGTVV
ncbi:MAG: VIT1/CCC1 transporter family protein [Candidatus Kariarchaeaceae archaeon]|jgi:predicted membrane protein (TIGR00267 family)